MINTTNKKMSSAFNDVIKSSRKAGYKELGRLFTNVKTAYEYKRTRGKSDEDIEEYIEIAKGVLERKRDVEVASFILTLKNDFYLK